MSNQTPPKRIHQIIKLKPEHYEAYKKCHAAVWHEVIEQIKKCHIEDCTCYTSLPLHSFFGSSKGCPYPLKLLFAARLSPGCLPQTSLGLCGAFVQVQLIVHG
jgi:hypothetical protein